MRKIIIAITFFGLVGSSFAGGYDDIKIDLPQFGIKLPKLTNGLTFSPSLTNVTTSVEGVDRNLNIYIGPAFSSNGIGAMAYVDFEIPMIVDNLTLGPYVGFGVGYIYNSKANKHVDSFGNVYYTDGYQSSPLLSFGAVAHYYFDWLIPNMKDKYDVFAKVKIGGNLGLASFGVFAPDIDAQVGARVNFSAMSLYGTVGYGRSYVNFGLSFGL